MLGLDSRITEREQSGRTMYRVRVGPYDKKDDAESARTKLAGAGVDAALVRVQRSP
jgi:cell division protein FtsN